MYSKMFFGVNCPKIITDDIFYYLYIAEDGIIHRKLYVKENGKLIEKEDEAIMPLNETKQLTTILFESPKIQWEEDVFVYSSLELKEYFLQGIL